MHCRTLPASGKHRIRAELAPRGVFRRLGDAKAGGGTLAPRDEAATIDKREAVGMTASPPRRGIMPTPDHLRAWRWPVMIGGPLLILAIAAYFVMTSGRSEGTDDAYVQAARVPISASIGGRVIELDVKENQRVKAGQVLFRLDTRDFQATMEQSAAQVAAAKLQVQALQA